MLKAILPDKRKKEDSSGRGGTYRRHERGVTEGTVVTEETIGTGETVGTKETIVTEET